MRQRTLLWSERVSLNFSPIVSRSTKLKLTRCASQWSVALITSRNRLGSYTACLNETSHLPVYWKGAGERFNTYIEWDPSVTIEPPDMNASVMEMPKMP